MNNNIWKMGKRELKLRMPQICPLMGSGQTAVTHLEAGCIMANIMDSGIILPGVNLGSSTY